MLAHFLCLDLTRHFCLVNITEEEALLDCMGIAFIQVTTGIPHFPAPLLNFLRHCTCKECSK